MQSGRSAHFEQSDSSNQFRICTMCFNLFDQIAPLDGQCTDEEN